MRSSAGRGSIILFGLYVLLKSPFNYDFIYSPATFHLNPSLSIKRLKGAECLPTLSVTLAFYECLSPYDVILYYLCHLLIMPLSS